MNATAGRAGDDLNDSSPCILQDGAYPETPLQPSNRVGPWEALCVSLDDRWVSNVTGGTDALLLEVPTTREAIQPKKVEGINHGMNLSPDAVQDFPNFDYHPRQWMRTIAAREIESPNLWNQDSQESDLEASLQGLFLNGDDDDDDFSAYEEDDLLLSLREIQVSSKFPDRGSRPPVMPLRQPTPVQFGNQLQDTNDTPSEEHVDSEPTVPDCEDRSQASTIEASTTSSSGCHYSYDDHLFLESGVAPNPPVLPVRQVTQHLSQESVRQAAVKPSCEAIMVPSGSVNEVNDLQQICFRRDGAASAEVPQQRECERVSKSGLPVTHSRVLPLLCRNETIVSEREVAVVPPAPLLRQTAQTFPPTCDAARPPDMPRRQSTLELKP